MSTDDGESAFRFVFNVPDDHQGVGVDKWLHDLADQIAANDTLSVAVTGDYIDDPDDPGGGDDTTSGAVSQAGDAKAQGAQEPAVPQKAVVYIMVCPGKRPYAPGR